MVLKMKKTTKRGTLSRIEKGKNLKKNEVLIYYQLFSDIIRIGKMGGDRAGGRTGKLKHLNAQTQNHHAPIQIPHPFQRGVGGGTAIAHPPMVIHV